MSRSPTVMTVYDHTYILLGCTCSNATSNKVRHIGRKHLDLDKILENECIFPYVYVFIVYQFRKIKII